VNDASFTVMVSLEDCLAFANLSGDWNQLHTDETYARRTTYGRPLLHGAFSAGLFSRLAGMYLPGDNCLLHGMRLRFLNPIFPPQALTVSGHFAYTNQDAGEVVATIRDTDSGRVMVEGGYSFSRHFSDNTSKELPERSNVQEEFTTDRVLVTGFSGGMGSAIRELLGDRALGTSRSEHNDSITVPNLEQIAEVLPEGKLSGIVHCAGPQPDNEGLLDHINTEAAVEHHIAKPLREVLALARVLRDRGTPGSPIILVGSTFATPGKHAWRNPLYSLSKSLIPTLTEILALELGVTCQMRAVGVVFDIIKGGMNRNISPAIEQAHADRTIAGNLPTMGEVATQIEWVLNNRSGLASGATLRLTGGALP